MELNTHLTSEKETRQIALRLADQIKFASWLGKNARRRNGRDIAYQVKAEKISNCLLHFGRFFKVKSYEPHEKLGTLLVVKLADGSKVHIPLRNLTGEAKSLVNLGNLAVRITLPKRSYGSLALAA